MTINKYIVYSLFFILILSLFGNYFFYSRLNESNSALSVSQGRIEILREEKKKAMAKVDSLDMVIHSDTVNTNVTVSNMKPIIKYYAVEKVRVAILPTDSAISFLSKKLSR